MFGGMGGLGDLINMYLYVYLLLLLLISGSREKEKVGVRCFFLFAFSSVKNFFGKVEGTALAFAAVTEILVLQVNL